MPFIACDSRKERIDITLFENPRNQISNDEVFCPFCKSKMFIRGGPKVVYHFYHQAKCKNDFERHPESILHLNCKRKVAEALKAEINEYSTAKIEYEFPIVKARRIADIMAIFPNGWMIAHEIQLSYISIETLEKRTEDYLSAGIDIVWWLGKSANTETNRDWCREKFGVCYTLNLSENFF